MRDKLMSEKTFCETMREIKESWDYIDNLNDFFRKNHVDGYLWQPNCIDTALDLLKFIFCDDGDWIGYYAYELYWGKKYKPGCVVSRNGTDIVLKSPEDLYQLLKKTKESESND